MSWVKLDDKFPRHPKVSQLTDREFRVHVRVLCYCAEHRTGGVIPPGIWTEVPGLSKRIGERLVGFGLWDEKDGEFAVHDWAHYNAPTLEERVAAYLLRFPEASANEVHRAIGGKRELVLTIVAALREAGSVVVPDQYPPGTHNGTPGGSLTGSESGSHAREPVPQPVPESPDPSLPENSNLFAVPANSEHDFTYIGEPRESELGEDLPTIDLKGA